MSDFSLKDAAEFLACLQITLNTRWPVGAPPLGATADRMRARLVRQCRGAADEARRLAQSRGAGTAELCKPFLLLADVAGEIHQLITMVTSDRLVADPAWTARRTDEIHALVAQADKLAADVLGIAESDTREARYRRNMGGLLAR